MIVSVFDLLVETKKITILFMIKILKRLRKMATF